MTRRRIDVAVADVLERLVDGLEPGEVVRRVLARLGDGERGVEAVPKPTRPEIQGEVGGQRKSGNHGGEPEDPVRPRRKVSSVQL